MIWTTIYQVNASIYGGINTLYIGVCLFVVALCEDFNESTKHLNAVAMKATHAKTQPSAEDYAKIKFLFNDLIEFHCKIRELGF